MKLLRLPLLCTLIVFTILTPVAGQQKRRTPDKVPVKPAVAPAPAPPTFENLLAADDFKIYVEVRNVGQLARSGATTDILEPILKLGGPPKDFIDFVEWLKSHAEQLTTSRMLIAVAPNRQNLPEFIAAIEFASPEEAAKFEKPLNSLLPTMFPPRPQSSPETEKKSPPQQPPSTEQQPAQQRLAEQKPPDQKPPATEPGYALQSAGSLLIVSPAPVQLKKLRPAGSKPIAEDPNFRVAYNRFASEPIFLFVDFRAMEKERQEREKQWEEERKRAAEASKERKEKEEQEEKEEKEDTESSTESTVTVEEKLVVSGAVAQPSPENPTETKEPSPEQVALTAVSAVNASLFSSIPVVPDALGLGFSPDTDSFDFRALMIDGAGKTSDPIPFLSWIKFGTPIAPQSPTVIPADSELVLTMSLDLQQLYARISAPTPTMAGRSSTGDDLITESTPVTSLEKVLKIKIKDDLLPLLGSEVAVSLPLAAYNPLAPPGTGPAPQSKDEAKKESTASPPAPFLVISVRDKEAMRKLMPKIIQGFAGQAAALAQTEKREDTELVSFANMFAYAFVGDFLVLSTDAATTRHVVDSYLKGATLAADVQFRNYTRWQPHELQGQLYVSSGFVEGYKTWANNPNARISEEARMFFTHLTAADAQPITYALSNDGLGMLHELHIPKTVLLLAVGAAAATENPPKHVANERAAMRALWTISAVETEYKAKHSTYGSLEELLAAKMIEKDLLESPNYKFEFTATPDGFTVSAVPTEYGKTGKLSFFLDQMGQIRGGDHAGAPASASDPPVGY